MSKELKRVKDILKSEDGKFLLSFMAKECNYDSNEPDFDNVNKTYFKAGQKEFVNRMAKYAALDKQGVIQLTVKYLEDL